MTYAFGGVDDTILIMSALVLTFSVDESSVRKIVQFVRKIATFFSRKIGAKRSGPAIICCEERESLSVALMSLQGRSSCVVLGLLLLTGTLSAGLSFTRVSGTFTPYVSEPLPQRVLGDFDGDGRSDTALIQEGAFGHYVSIQLSGSAAVSLEATVVSLTEGDIDHDGDLDLVAAMPSGDVLIWLNDGHGRFTPKEVSQTPALAGESVIVSRLFDEPMAVGVTAPVVVQGNRAHTPSVVAHIRPPTRALAFDFGLLILPAFRAPPVLSV